MIFWIIVISLLLVFLIVFLAFFPIRITWFYYKQYRDEFIPPVRRRKNRRRPAHHEDYEVYDDAEL